MHDGGEPLTLLVARFEDLVAAGLRSVLGADRTIRIVAADVAAERLDAALAEHGPRVALLNFGALGAPVEVRRLGAAHPGTRLVVLANNPTRVECDQLLALGATACLGKGVEGRDVLTALHLAARGLHVLPRSAPAAGGSQPPDRLTRREADVLELLQRGHSNGEIAALLSVSVETVRTHARGVFRKLGVSGRRELAILPRARR